MPYNETIRQLTIEDKNHADVFNTVITKLLENTNYNKDEIQKLEKQLRDVISQFDGYLTTEELIALLEKGIKGDKGDDGIGIQYIWDGTSLGVKRENEEEYSYAQLKGAQGEPGEVTLGQLEAAVSTHDNNATSHKPLRDWVQNLFESLKLTWDSITGKPETFPPSVHQHSLNDISGRPSTYPPSAHGHSVSEITGLPTSLPASDVYPWAKASSKPNYNASEVGALPNVGYGGVHELGQYLDFHRAGSSADYDARIEVNASNQIVNTDVNGSYAINAEIANLKSTVVSGKTSVANAINGKLGTSLSNQTSFADMAYYIGTMAKQLSVSNMKDLGSDTDTISGYLSYILIDKATSTSIMELIINGNYSMYSVHSDGSVKTNNGTSYDLYTSGVLAFILFTDITTTVRTKGSYRYHRFGIK